MQFTSLTATVLSLLAANAAAKTIQIKVGDNGQDFSPNTVTAEKGDTVEYHFIKNKHSVVAGDFTKGCSPVTPGGFFSGIVSTPSVFSVTINNTDPIFFYCSYAKHCQGGMVGVINPSPDQMLEKFQSTAKASTSNVSPEAPYGGMLMAMSSMSGSMSTATSTSSSSSPSQTKAGAAGHLSASLLTIAGAAAGAAAFLV